MSTSLESTDQDGKTIEVGSVINYYRSDGWHGGYRHDGLVLEVKPKSYVVQPLMEQAVTVGGERVTLVLKDWRDETHRVAKERETRYGSLIRPKLVRSAEEQAAFQVVQDDIRERAAAERARLDEANEARRLADNAAEQKRRDINDSINAAVETLKNRYREEFDGLVADNYRDKGVTVADLDAADTYYNRAYTVRPEGWSAMCGCMTEDPGDGGGERVVTHSLACSQHPEHEGSA